MMKAKNSYRDGDTLIEVTVETKPAVVDFADLLDATEVENDDCHSDAPWECCDGYDHEVIKRRDDREIRREARGFCFHDGEREHVQIVLTDKDDTDLYNWHRRRGASRQVARERVAEDRRLRLDQLTNWYRNGWNWYYVKGEFDGHFASLGGIDDYNYADDYMRLEIAHELVHELEQAGYTVVNKPVDDSVKLTARPVNDVLRPGPDGAYGCYYEPCERRMTAAQWREEYRRNLALQSWKGLN
jgi:hypothetical protein